VEGRDRRFGITRLHIEEDAGKSLHDGMPDSGERSYVDLNRSGIPLAEIVSEPDFRSSWEAYDYIQYLRRTLVYVDASDANMEEGNLRCDANVSVRERGALQLGTKVELKNLNSARFLQKAIEYEIDRQIAVIENGGTVIQETRLWNERENRTYTMRSKEDAHDYRYFPEPDLPPLRVPAELIDRVRAELPELPEAARRRFVAEYGLGHEDASVLTVSRALAQYFERTALASGNPRAAANWIRNELLRELDSRGLDTTQSPVTSERLGELIRAIDTGDASGPQSKKLLLRMFETDKSLAELLDELGGRQINDPTAVRAIVDQVVASNPKQVEQFRAGKDAVFGFFVGQVMKSSGGKANAKIVNELLKETLAK
jgi:aspartyl-tRNA(Asn)/glutamyl-tRNA(Gln) amidotransferase subunit B